jgi:two-component system nitrogen regulation response regulator NtrX
VIVVSVPSLNERRDDIPLLIEHFNRRIADDYGHPAKVFTPGAIAALQEYNWTGNIRELANVIERLFILCDQAVQRRGCTVVRVSQEVALYRLHCYIVCIATLLNC